ncbi:MAG: hypothetical protein A2516_03175, partial [Alphaproteobacteria bacterium RIFOXYD12_FULL_60_8]
MTHNSPKPPSRTRRALALAKLGLAAAALYAVPTLMQLDQAQASGGGGGGGFGGGSGAVEVAQDPTAAKECGDCHIAYGPRYLPDGSWSQMINNLSDHFGEDASLDKQTTQQIASYYTANAGGRGTGALRITDTRWFVGAHRGEVSFGRTSPAKCEQCHNIPGQKQQGGGSGFGNWFG